jgi:hypothetical protein
LRTACASILLLMALAASACSRCEDSKPDLDLRRQQTDGVQATVVRGLPDLNDLADRARLYIRASVRTVLNGADGNGSSATAQCRSALGELSIHCSEQDTDRVRLFTDLAQDGIKAWKEAIAKHPELIEQSTLVIDIRADGLADSVRVRTSTPWARARNQLAIQKFREYQQRFSDLNIEITGVRESDLNQIFACIRAYEALEMVQPVLASVHGLSQSDVKVRISCSVSAQAGPQYRGASLKLSSHLAVPERLGEETVRRFREKGFAEAP